MSKLINLTGHPVDIFHVNGKDRLATIPTGPTTATAYLAHVPGEPINGIPIVRALIGETEGLPLPKPGVFYIVSSLVARTAIDRSDLLAPDTGPTTALRGANGRIRGVRALRSYERI